MSNKMNKESDFKEFYLKMKSDAYKAALYYTRDLQVAEEITQQAFYHLFLRYERLREETKKAYLIRIIRNAAYTWTKYERRNFYFEHRLITGDDLPHDHGADDWCLLREDRRLSAQLTYDILTALKKKNRIWYEAIVKLYVFDYTPAEAARELGMSREELNARVYRAKKWVRKRYQDRYDEIYKPV